jgi:hypothetical protein
MDIPLPTEFIDLTQALTMAIMSSVVFLIVQATKELPGLKQVPTLLYAWGLSALLLFFGTWLKGGSFSWTYVYLAIVNGVLTAGAAVLMHQAGLCTGALKEKPRQG